MFQELKEDTRISNQLKRFKGSTAERKLVNETSDLPNVCEPKL